MFDALSPYTSPISPVYLPVAGGGDVRRARRAGGGHARRGPRPPGAGHGGLATLRGGERGAVEQYTSSIRNLKRHLQKGRPVSG